MSTTYDAGIIISTQKGIGTYRIAQERFTNGLPPLESLQALGMNVNDQKGIDFTFGPISIAGFVDTSSLGFGVAVLLFGIYLGTFYGDLEEGLSIEVDIGAAKGEIKLYLKDSAVYIRSTLGLLWGNGINLDQKLFDLPTAGEEDEG